MRLVARSGARPARDALGSPSRGLGPGHSASGGAASRQAIPDAQIAVATTRACARGFHLRVCQGFATHFKAYESTRSDRV